MFFLSSPGVPLASGLSPRLPLCLVILGLSGLVALGTPVSAADHWSRTYGGPGTYEGVFDLRELPDGSIVVAGHTDSFGTQTGDAWRILLDGEGNVIEELVFGNGIPGGVTDIAIDADGGMAAVGANTLDPFSDRDAWIHHVDAAGSIDWQWEFDADPGMHSFHAVAPTTGSGYIAVGTTSLSNTVPFYAWVAKFDSAGGLEWQQRYHGGTAEHANFVVQTQDEGYAIAGWTTSSGAGATDVWLLKIDGNGIIEWQKTYGGFDQEEATGIIQTADGGYALSAFTNTFPSSGHAPWILRLDSAGNVIWHAVMGDSEWGDFRGITQTQGGDLIATGRVSSPASNDLWVVKFRDTDGAVLWQRSYQGTLGDWGAQTVELDNADLLIGGIWGWGFPEEDIWLQRTDGNGLIAGCGLVVDTAVEADVPGITVLDATTTASAPSPIAVATSFVSGPSTLTTDTKCVVATTEFVRGDGNGDGAVDIADPVYNLAFLFTAGPSLCLDAQDTNDDGTVDVSDPVYNLNQQFSMGPPPPAPFPGCGEDPTPDGLDCETEPVCP